MKIYLDMCSVQRPLDEATQLRIRVEAEAILGILALRESGRAALIASEALVYEVQRNPHAIRKRFAYEVLASATHFVEATDPVATRARAYVAGGIPALDALHLASAVEADADYICTCDDSFLKRAKGLDTGRTRVVSPLELIQEVGE